MREGNQSLRTLLRKLHDDVAPEVAEPGVADALLEREFRTKVRAGKVCDFDTPQGVGSQGATAQERAVPGRNA